MKILFTGVYSHLYGGLERFAERAAAALREQGHVVDVVGDPPHELDDRDLVLMQKIPPTVADLRRLKARYGERLRFYAHDHELYCLRKHYYDPLRRLCDRTYSFLPCRLCAAVTRPQWVLRNVFRPLCAFLDEMRDVRTFVPANYIRDNLVKNGFSPDRVKVLYPLFVRPFRDEGKLRRQAPRNVRFLGWQENAQRFFKDADVCAVPSLWHEPFGTVGAEALSHGVPVATFDVGGLYDWLLQGETGMFATTEDGSTRTSAARTPAAFARALDAMANPETLKRMSVSALATVERLFAPDKFMKELLEW